MFHRFACLVLMLLSSVALCAQSHTDSTDIFYGHTDLGEATVTGVTGRVRQSQSPIPVSLIGAHDMHQSSSSNVVATLAQFPGISQVTTGSGISKPIIRGLGYNRIVCIADGVRQEGQQWGDEHGLELDATSVESVEVIKGPATLMYGSDAMAGVLIFKPHALLAEGLMRGNASAEYQTGNGLWRYELGHSGNVNGWVWDARFAQQAAHAYRNARDGYVRGSQFRSHALRGMVGRSQAWGHSMLTLSLYALTPSIAEGDEDDHDEPADDAPDTWRGRSYGHTLPFQRVNHFKAVLDNAFHFRNGTLTAIMAYQQNVRKEYEEQPDEYGLRLDLHVATLDVRYTHVLAHGWKLSTGVAAMWQHSLNKGTEYLGPDFTLLDLGAFVTAQRELGRWTLSGGLRFDNRHLRAHALQDEGELRFDSFSRTFDGLTGSAGAVWHVAHGLNLRGNVARGFRAPNLPELSSNGIHEGAVRYEVGNHQLKAEQSWQVDLGADYINRWLSAEAALFYSFIDNYIFTHRTSRVAEGYPVYQYTSGNARLGGFELGIDVHPIHTLHLKNTFSYVHAKQTHQTAQTKYLPLTPAPHWRAEVKWELPAKPATTSRLALANAYASLAMDCYLRQGFYYALDNTETATPSYTLFTLSIGTDLVVRQRKVADIFLAVNNLLDRAYQSHLSRLKYVGTSGLYNPGRSLTLKISIPF